MEKLSGRLNDTQIRVLAEFLNNRDRELHGFDIYKKIGSKKTSVYRFLDKLESMGWLEAAWEKNDLIDLDRPRRRYYHLTKAGKRLAETVVSDSETADSTYSYVSSPQASNPGVKVKSLEGTWNYGRELGKSDSYIAYEFEVDPDSNESIILPFGVVTDLEEDFPFNFKSVTINGVDHSGNSKLNEEKVTLDLKNGLKEFDYTFEIPIQKFVKGRSIELEIRSSENKAKSVYPQIQVTAMYPTENIRYEYSAGYNRLRLARRDHLDQEVSNFVTAKFGLWGDGLIDPKESRSSAETLTTSSGSIVWKPKMKLGYSYYLHTKLEELNDESQQD